MTITITLLIVALIIALASTEIRRITNDKLRERIARLVAYIVKLDARVVEADMAVAAAMTVIENHRLWLKTKKGAKLDEPDAVTLLMEIALTRPEVADAAIVERAARYFSARGFTISTQAMKDAKEVH